ESIESEAESWERDEDDNNNDHDSSNEGSDQESNNSDENSQSDKEKGSNSEHATDENESGFKSDQEENEEDVKDDEEEQDDEFVKTPSNSTDDEDETNVESKVVDKAEDDEDEGMDYTTNQFDDDVDVRLNEPVNTEEGLIQKEGTDAEMINVQQGNENLEITLNQVIEDAHVTISTVSKKTEVPVTNSSHSSDLAAKFLNFTDIPTTDAEIVSLMDVHVHHEVPSSQTPTLLIVPISVITESSPVFTTVIPQSLPSFTPPPQQSTLTPPPTTEATNPPFALLNFASILPKKVSNFAPPVIKSMVTESLEHAVLAKESSQPKSTYEAAASLTEFELKKILIDKIDEKNRKDKDKDEDPSAGSGRGLKKRKISKDDEPTKGPKAKESKSGSSKGTKSQLKSSGKSVHAEEPEFEVADSEMPQDQEENLGDDNEEPKRKTPQQGPTQSWLMTLASSADKMPKNFDELMSTPIDFFAYIMNGLKITNLTQETLLRPACKLLKGTHTNFVELEYDFEECYKALSEKLDWENPEGGDYLFDLTKPLPLVMNGNCQIVPVDFFFNNDLKYLQGEISTMTYTTSITKTKAAQYDLQALNTWFQTFRVLLKSPMINMHFGVFLIGEINNRLTNLSGNYVSDFAIALRMFTKSMVIQKRVEDLQLGVESYQRKINITKPETTKPGIRKRDPYTPYQDPQGFIYVDNKGRNRLMRSDELYKFSDGTLTGLRTLLDDITKNIRMEYLPQRRWSTLEKKRAHIMIKAIDKQLEERRMMRSFKKFVGGRHYETDLWLLQRTI
ncbi:hypothetical protein Tco_0514191, partial [Tanacetum coccineum]